MMALITLQNIKLWTGHGTRALDAINIMVILNNMYILVFIYENIKMCVFDENKQTMMKNPIDNKHNFLQTCCYR